MGAQQAKLLVSPSGQFILYTNEAVSPQWLQSERWEPSWAYRGAWAAPSHPGRFRRLQEALGDGLTLDESAAAWFQGQQLPIPGLPSAPLDLSMLDERLFPHQLRTIEWALRHRRALIAPDPGLGKTAISVSASRLLPPGRVIVICPVTLMRNWAREIAMWSPGSEVTTWHGDIVSKVHEGSPNGRRYLVVNYDTVVRKAGAFAGEGKKRSFVPNERFKTLIKTNFVGAIVDESLMIKNRTAQRSQVLKELLSWVDTVWLLSGSPSGRYYDDVFHQIHVLSPRLFGSYWQFARRYCELETNQWGTSVVGNKSGADETMRRDLREWYYPLSYEDSGLNIPEWVFQDEYVELSGKQWDLYNQMHQSFLMDLEATEDEPEGSALLAPITVTKLLRLQQIASNPSIIGGVDQSAKWDYVINRLEYTEGPVIIWTSFLETARKMLDRVVKTGRTADVLTGTTPESRRQSIVDSFQGGHLDVLICHPGVGKFGLTLTRGRTAIYLERSWNGDDYYQSLYRIRRIGTTKPPVVIRIIATGPDGEATVDSAIRLRLDYRFQAARSLSKEQVIRSLSGKVDYSPLPAPATEGKAAALPAPVSAAAPVAAPPATAPRPFFIKPGYYTVTLPDGEHRTIRVAEWEDMNRKEVRRVAFSLLVGPDNGRDYRGFGDWVEGGEPRIWSKFRSDGSLKKVLDLLLSSDPSQSGHLYALQSGRCYRCNRLLTVPASIHRGLGPDCANKE